MYYLPYYSHNIFRKNMELLELLLKHTEDLSCIMCLSQLILFKKEFLLSAQSSVQISSLIHFAEMIYVWMPSVTLCCQRTLIIEEKVLIIQFHSCVIFAKTLCGPKVDELNAQ